MSYDDDEIDYAFVDQNGVGYTNEEMGKYFNIVGMTKDGKPILEVKPEYQIGKLHQSANVGLAIGDAILRIFGL